ncbi:unnamed protein product [Ilex paraguariensis]|uniref:DEUBAD domain-containing protein n=1 Tax=Ilex paraguariensis TaxID=185542 RepID=A0ABC8T9U0_9AQUA
MAADQRKKRVNASSIVDCTTKGQHKAKKKKLGLPQHDKRKKRVNASSIVDCTTKGQHKAKKKKLRLPQHGLNMRPTISLEWDDKKKSVVAKREQIGISWTASSPFIDAVPLCSNILADILTVPREIFELENLTEVLSYEVWQTRLSESEQNLLTQCLPKGAEPQEVVQELLAGDNFHFGNPFLRWGSLLCSGNLHPDHVIHREKNYKANKKAYCSELQKYHNDMIGNLQMWKGRWESCKDPENESVQKIWRSKKLAEKSVPAHANGFRLCDSDENPVATSESCSWAADEKACSSDNPNLMHGEPQRLICRKGNMECKYDYSSDGLKVAARHRKVERLHKYNIQCGDGAKYMSYIKVSREQHQRVKSSMKHSSNSIQHRSLNSVLGNLDTFHVQPFEVFEEEERQKLHEHWLQLAIRDLPAAVANWRRRQEEKWELTKSLEQELEEKLKSLKEDEEENYHDMLLEQKDDGAADLEPTLTLEDEDKEKSDSLLREHTDNAVALEDEENENPDCILQDQTDNEASNLGYTMVDNNESVSACMQNQGLQRISSFSGRHEFHSMDLDSDDNHLRAKIGDIPPSVSGYPDNLNHVDIPVSQGNVLSSSSDAWPAVSMSGSYYRSTVSHEYPSASDLSLPRDIDQQPVGLIDLESEMREEDSGKNLLHRQSNDVSFLSPYPQQDRNELLQSFFNGQGSLSFHHQQKQTGLNLQPAGDVMMGTSQFPGHFGEQLPLSLPVALEQKRLNDIYFHQNTRENIFPDGGRYSIPRQEHFSPVNIPNWAVNNARMSAPPQPQLNGEELLSQNWFSGEHRGRCGWSGSEDGVGPNNIGNRNNADETLFGVVSECNELRYGAPYNSMMGPPTEQFIQSRNYGVVGVPRNNHMLPQMGNPVVNYSSGHETAGGLKNNNMGWMSLPHPGSALQDSIRKPFMRSWDR